VTGRVLKDKECDNLMIGDEIDLSTIFNYQNTSYRGRLLSQTRYLHDIGFSTTACVFHCFKPHIYIYIHMSDGLIDSMHMKLIAAVIEICSNYWQPIQFHNTAPKFNIALENRPSQKETSSSKLHLTGLSWSSGVQTAWMLCLMMLASFQSYPSTGFRIFLLEKMLCAAGAYSASGLLWWWSAAAGRNLCFIVPLSFPSVPYHNRVLFQHVVALCSSIRSKNVWTHVFQHSSSSHPKHGNGRVWRIYHKRITYKDSINISE